MEQMSETFYQRLDRIEQENRIARIFKDRPENLHDYQGCANDPKMQPNAPLAGGESTEMKMNNEPVEKDATEPATLPPLDVTDAEKKLAKDATVGAVARLLAENVICRKRQLLAALTELQALKSSPPTEPDGCEVLYSAERMHDDGWHVYHQPDADRDRVLEYLRSCGGSARLVRIESRRSVEIKRTVFGDGRIEELALSSRPSLPTEPRDGFNEGIEAACVRICYACSNHLIDPNYDLPAVIESGRWVHKFKTLDNPVPCVANNIRKLKRPAAPKPDEAEKESK
jgi:hypothetical protein